MLSVVLDGIYPITVPVCFEKKYEFDFFLLTT